MFLVSFSCTYSKYSLWSNYSLVALCYEELLHVLYDNWMSYYRRPLTVDAGPERSVFMVMSCTVWNRSITVSFCDGIVLWQYLLLFSNITILYKNARAVYTVYSATNRHQSKMSSSKNNWPVRGLCGMCLSEFIDCTVSWRIRIFNCIEEVPQFFFSIEFNSTFQIFNCLQFNCTPYTI